MSGILNAIGFGGKPAETAKSKGTAPTEADNKAKKIVTEQLPKEGASKTEDTTKLDDKDIKTTNENKEKTTVTETVTEENTATGTKKTDEVVVETVTETNVTQEQDQVKTKDEQKDEKPEVKAKKEEDSEEETPAEEAVAAKSGPKNAMLKGFEKVKDCCAKVRWEEVAAIVSFVVAALIIVFAALCLSGRFPPPFMGGMVGCAAAIVCGSLLVIFNGMVLWRRCVSTTTFTTKPAAEAKQ